MLRCVMPRAAIVDALKISVGELAGKTSHRVKLQRYRNGAEKIAMQQTGSRSLAGRHPDPAGSARPRAATIGLANFACGTAKSSGLVGSQRQPCPCQGHHALRPPPHGLNMSGRWVCLGYDDYIMTGWASIGQTLVQAEETIARLTRRAQVDPAATQLERRVRIRRQAVALAIGVVELDERAATDSV